ncbi:MAG TPA: DUF3795 domain-containing protein [bacterium]|nr:DUF3795 domain-containing protein [bacterium]
MKEIVADKALVARCGLYCGACRSYLAEKCPGCDANEKASWCGIRKCTKERGIASCADCKDFAEVNDCRKFNNFISKVIGFVLRSNRRACIEAIRKNGYEVYATTMATTQRQTIKR